MSYLIGSHTSCSKEQMEAIMEGHEGKYCIMLNNVWCHILERKNATTQINLAYLHSHICINHVSDLNDDRIVIFG